MRIFAGRKATEQSAVLLRSRPRAIQPKLAITAPGDRFEQEADRVSGQVMRTAEPRSSNVCACGGGCPRCRNEQASTQRLQTARVRQDLSDHVAAPPHLAEVLSSPGQPLDAGARWFMESRFGHDFSHVRVHTGPRADLAVRAVQARAFAVDRHLVFGAGHYDPQSTEGRRLLAHELTHVIQQRPGDGGDAAHLTAAPVIQRQKAGPAEQAAATEDAAFWEWWKKVVGFEGPLKAWRENPGNKHDLGKETNWGVTKKLYMERAAGLGLPATDEGFEAMTPDQAMLFGKMMWKASRAKNVTNTGVALVLADWYWGGIDLDRFKALLAEKGRAATFEEGKPDAATIAFLNTLPPAELVELMSQAKAAQFKERAEKNKTQQGFLTGWLNRNEERRIQAQPFLPGAKFPPKPGMTLAERGERALREARKVVEMGQAASSDDRKIVSSELWSVVGAIELQQKTGFANPQDEAVLKPLKSELLKEIGRLMNVPH